MLDLSWRWLAHWADSLLLYCPRCHRAMPCRKSMVEGAWICQRCGRRI